MSTIDQFIREQRRLAEKENDPGVRYGITKALDSLERSGISSTPLRHQKTGRWVPIKEALEHYGVSESTLRSWKREGRVVFRQPGGRQGIIQFLIDD